MKMPIQSPHRNGLLQRLSLFAIILPALMLNIGTARAQNSPPSRPILFVHGICANAYDAEPLFNNIYPQLDPGLYPSPTVYFVQFNSVHNTIQFWILEGAGTPLQFLSPMLETSIPSSARLFSIMLYDPISNSTDAENVAKISILNKAYEVSQVIKHITAITHIKDVIVLGHSMGGLDARAYIENLASQGACYDYNNNTPYYGPDTCKPGCNSASCMPNASYGTAGYAGDIGDLITIDTPHSGTPLAVLSVDGANIPLGCFLGPKTNTYELEDSPADLFGYLINALDYSGQLIANEQPTTNTVPIQAVQDYLTDVTNNTVWPLLPGESDDVVPIDSQGIPTSLQTNSTASVVSQLKDVPIAYSSSDISSNQGCFFKYGVLSEQVLHFMSCLGTLPLTQSAIADQIYANDQGTLTSISVQATNNGGAWTGAVSYRINGPNNYSQQEITAPMTVSDVPLGMYSISQISGGPSGAATPTVTASPTPTIQLGQWATTFTINFTDKSLSSTTVSSSATQVDQGATVTLTAKVQSTAGTPTGAITFYDNGTTLSSIMLDSSGTGTYPTTALPVGPNSITASYGGDANFNASTSMPTTVTVISSSLILPAPALTSPPNGGTNQLTTPVFIWSQVLNNSGYRIMVASSLAALPTDPNASSCLPVDSACVIDQALSLNTGVNYYSPPSGLLLPGNTYYWQVHARASVPYLPGYWSVARFSTSAGVQPPLVNTGAAASVTTNSATLTGTVNPNGLDAHSYFLFGTSSALSGAIQTPSQDLGSGNLSSGVNANISGLREGTQYYFQLVSSNNSGTSKGAINTFTTSNGSQAVLTINNSAGGAVFSFPGHIECPSACSDAFPSGTSVTLEAIPTPGWFPAWTGCDSVNGDYCTLTMWLSRTVSVTYAQHPASPLTLQPTSLSFSSATGVQSQVGQVFITNSGSTGLNPITVAITGTNAANFNETNNCPTYGLNAGNECIASVTFTPSSIGSFSALLSVSSSNAAASPLLVPLSGMGISGNLISPTVQVTPALTSITTAQTLMVAVAVNGGSGNPGPTGTVTLISGSYTSQATPLSNGSTTISVPAGALSVGTDQLTAAYQGDNNYSSQNGTNSVTVTGAQISCDSYSSASQITGITQPLRLGFGNGKLVAGGIGQAYIVDPTSSQITTVPFTQYSGGFAGKVSVINSQAFIPISNLSQGEVAVLSLGTATVSQYLQVGVEPYGSLVAGNQLYIGDSVLSGNGSPSQVYVVNPASGQIVTSINAGQVIQALASDPVHNTIYALNYNDGTASVIDLTSNAVTATIPLGVMPTSGIVVNDKLLVVGDIPRTQQGEIVEIDTSSNTVEGSMLAVGRDPFEIVAVNGCAFVPNSSDSTISVVDLATDDIVKTISSGIGQDPTGAAVDPSSGYVYIANQLDNSISVLTPGSASTPTMTVTPSAASITTAQPLTVTVAVNGGTGNPTPTGSVTITSGSYTSTATVLSGGSATIIIPAGSLNTGSDTLAVGYTPDSSSSSRYNGASGAASVLVTSLRTTPTVTVTPSAPSITTAQPLTVTVAVNGGTGNPTPTGTVTLTGGGYASLATALSSGSATISIPAGKLSTGSDTLAASYIPDSSSSSTYNSASGSVSVTVTVAARVTPTVTVTPSSSSITTAQPLTVTVAVNGGTGNPTPTGTVTLTGGGYTSAATTLSSGSASINLPANSLSAGSDSLAVSYTPDSSSSSIYNSASGVVTVTVTTPAKTTPTVTVTQSSSSITTAQALTVTIAVNGGSGNPTPTGSVTLTGGGYTSPATTLTSGSVSINIPAGSMATGSDTLTVSYTPDSNSSSTYNSATGSNSVTVTTPAKTTPTVTVTPSASSITTAQALTVTVVVSGGTGNPTPTGSVTLIAAGTLSNGANTLTASYSGDATYAVASSTTTVAVEPVSISTTVPSPVNPGSSTTSTLTLTGSGGYSGTMNLSCSLTSSPAGAQSLPTCALNPASVTLASGGSGTSTLTVKTTAASTSALALPTDQHLWKLSSGGAVLAALLLFGIPFRRHRWISMLTLLMLVTAAGAIGCGGGAGANGGGGGGSTAPATTAGNYSFTVSATDSANAKITTSTTISVTVQ
jgi:YVTN family beta-propeller protein